MITCSKLLHVIQICYNSVTFLLHLNYIAVTFAGDSGDKKKPDPKIYNVAARRLGVDPADCVVVEDSTIVT
jgi:HAD superfamily hydrolase (TIGR01509 family)